MFQGMLLISIMRLLGTYNLLPSAQPVRGVICMSGPREAIDCQGTASPSVPDTTGNGRISFLAQNKSVTVNCTLHLMLFSWIWSTLLLKCDTSCLLTTNVNASTHLDRLSKTLGMNVLGVAAALNMCVKGDVNRALVAYYLTGGHSWTISHFIMVVVADI